LANEAADAVETTEVNKADVVYKPGDADEAEANEADKAEAGEADAEVNEAVEAILDNAANKAIVANEAAD
jgi:hypothetical protein